MVVELLLLSGGLLSHLVIVEFVLPFVGQMPTVSALVRLLSILIRIDCTSLHL